MENVHSLGLLVVSSIPLIKLTFISLIHASEMALEGFDRGSHLSRKAFQQKLDVIQLSNDILDFLSDPDPRENALPNANKRNSVVET